MTIKEVLKWGHETLILTSDSARLDAEVLLSHILKRPVTFLLAHDDREIGFFALWRYKRAVGKRKEGMPVAYLVGHKEFFMLDFVVNKHVMTPRPDTEFLVESVIEYIKGIKGKADPLLLDIGTGSACIPVSVLKNVEGVKAIAIDVCGGALRVARRNIKKHGLRSRIKLIRSDLLEKVPIKLLRGHDVIVTANLPYIPEGYKVSPELKYEPPSALFGGSDGMDIYGRLVAQLIAVQPRAIFFELFEHQIALLKTRLPDYKLKYVKDMSGEARALCMERVAS
jgi:release factor glutamine methyltransferase